MIRPDFETASAVVPTLPPPTATLKPTQLPTATAEPTLTPTATLEPTALPTATAEPTSVAVADATETPDPAQPTLTIPQRATLAAENARIASMQCLGCHGPFETLIANTEPFMTADGEEVNPHVTLDKTIKKVHESGEGMLECQTCHGPHPQPLVNVSDVAPADVDYCYL